MLVYIFYVTNKCNHKGKLYYKGGGNYEYNRVYSAVLYAYYNSSLFMCRLYN